ncbi:hypothetical protein SAMN04489732_108119 [Amycolatopsis saalfeldensis]|uniref:Uncharacterized protein n=1 Tax=Amycolatopsis saalfeldensis TaxID=394193 RepID=A0A1H8XMF8_9PSEU|nr:hypothetical protein SAMN04489732_108119 [Amycolatopsis saalfeldensis]
MSGRLIGIVDRLAKRGWRKISLANRLAKHEDVLRRCGATEAEIRSLSRCWAIFTTSEILPVTFVLAFAIYRAPWINSMPGIEGFRGFLLVGTAVSLLFSVAIRSRVSVGIRVAARLALSVRWICEPRGESQSGSLLMILMGGLGDDSGNRRNVLAGTSWNLAGDLCLLVGESKKDRAKSPLSWIPRSVLRTGVRYWNDEFHDEAIRVCIHTVRALRAGIYPSRMYILEKKSLPDLSKTRFRLRVQGGFTLQRWSLIVGIIVGVVGVVVNVLKISA